MPKAPSVSSEDEDDKTTIESGWEEEASTTVEQGDVAERLRALSAGSDPKRRSNTNITSTDGGSMPDELTVDEPRANIALAMLPPPVVARLVITAGNDSGQALEVRPGKTFTIGRGIDNDLVLTDIAVSRKHFDVRHDNGAWVLADRGSGNGTLVNARIEDAPFMLASGDVIEIGNTAFRFDLPNGTPRRALSTPPEGNDDLEMSTVSGKPFRDLESSAPAEPELPPARPKPLLPPAPLPPTRAQLGRSPTYALDRPGSRAASQAIATAATQPPLPPTPVPVAPPLIVMTGPGPHTLHLPQPSSTLPLPQMANRPPLGAMGPSGLLDAASGPLPSTIPGGQVAPLSRPSRLPFASYAPGQPSPPATAEIPTTQRAATSSRQPMVVAAGHTGRDATTTALIQPIAHAHGPPVLPQPSYGPAMPISRQAKMVLAGVGVALFAAVATIAIIKGARNRAAASKPAPAPARSTQPVIQPIDSRPARATAPPAPPTRTVIVTPTTTPTTAPTTTPTTAPTATPTTAPTTTTASTAPARVAPTPTTAPTTASPPTTVARTTPPTTTAPAIATAPTTTAPPPLPTTATAPPLPTTAPPPTTATAPRTTAGPRTPIAAKSGTVPTPPPVATTTQAVTATAPTRIATAPPVAAPDKKAIKKPDKKPDKKPAARNDVANIEIEHTDKPEPARPDKKRGRTTQDVKNDANSLYRSKNFAGAAALITAALPSFTGGDAQELRSMAAIYSQLGKAYNIGMAPGTKPTEAYPALRRATSYDRDVGSAYISELQEHLVIVATRAAVSYMASKEYESAFQAVRTSESLGSSSSSNKAVRDKLETIAADLYRTAQGELASDAEAAKKKLHQILGMVDPKHPVYAKAQKLLNAP